MMKDNYIYEGTVRHRRYTPFNRTFKYKIFMTFFDISHIEDMFKRSILWNINKRALISFYRIDYHGDPKISLDQSVRQTIKEKTNYMPKGPIRLLTHLRYFGYCFNPVSFYYCYDKNDSQVELIMAEVTNTPWNERHCYFITNKKNKSFKENLKKKFHVSPFWDMDHDYEWLFSQPEDSINVHMVNFKEGDKIFDATLQLSNKVDMSFKKLIINTFKYPFITLTTYLRIHFQALILLIRGATFHNHPKYNKAEQ